MNVEVLGRIGVFSVGVARLPRLKAFLACEELVFRPSAAQAKSLAAVVGWGHKPTADRAREYAELHGVRYLALEDGFLRSVGLGKRTPPLSVVIDDLGIYYDARAPSRLERILAGEGTPGGDALADPALLERARQCRERIVETDVSKYNHAPDVLSPELLQGDPYVVVADQTFDDASVAQGLAGPETFERMLEAAIAEHPSARIVVKVHPETIAGKKRGYLAQRPRDTRVTIAAEDMSPRTLLRRASHVYVCTSQLGFEALLSGVPVSCFGVPFYAGWGLTDDRQTAARRSKKRSLDELVAAALLLYPRYVHPVSGKRCEAEEVIEHLALNRRLFAENQRRFLCFGFSSWKRPFVRRYLQAPGNQVRFVRSPQRAFDLDVSGNLTAVVWASRNSAAIRAWASERTVPLWHMEDGFLRSVGLGSDLTAPGSLVLDREGIYYDPRTPSELETLLQTAQFSPAELERAAGLRRRIVDSGVSKYNSRGPGRLQLGAAKGQRIVFVPGQVEDDASVRFGSSRSVQDNKSLLRAVRKVCPDAYVVYKPHPDVLSGNRPGAVRSDGE
ncbi:MAG TPA: hypothetical protein VGP93_12845, partial [Polyangiaceae bacterium]|nr:hypothetical protein [Polyangiaceae bacterium]